MKLLLAIFIFAITACQSLSTKERFYLESRQTSHLKLQENLDARLYNSAVPLVTEDKIVTGNAFDGIRVFSLQGNPLWAKNIEGGIEGGFTYKDNRLYFGANDYKFYALNLESGVEVWRFETEGEVLSRPLLYNDKLYFNTGNNILYCLSAKEGRLLWRYKRNMRESFTVRGASTPIFHNGRIFVGFADGFFTAINPNDGSLIWERNLATSLKFKDIDAEAVAENDTIYISAYDSALYAISAKEGRVLWSLDHGSSSAVTISKEHLYYSTSDSRLLVLDKSSGKILSEKAAKGIFQSAKVQDNLLFVADTAGAVSVYDIPTDKLLQTFYPGHGISSPLVVGKENVYFLSFGANFYHLVYGYKKPLVGYE